MAVFRNCWHEELTVGWAGRKQTVGPDETIEVPDSLADDPETDFGERWVRVDGGTTPTVPAVDA